MTLYVTHHVTSLPLVHDPGKIRPHDPEKITHDLSRNWSSTKSHDKTCFGHMSNLLINMWKIMGTINKDATHWGKTPIKRYDIIHSYCALTAQSPGTYNCTSPKLHTDHPVLVYKTYKFR